MLRLSYFYINSTIRYFFYYICKSFILSNGILQLQTSLPNDDSKYDQSIDEYEDIVVNEDMSSALSMTPMMLQECNQTGNWHRIKYPSKNIFNIKKCLIG